MTKRLSKEEILERARKAHGDRYDYSLIEDENFEYKGVNDNFPFICKKHGIFWQTASHHFHGQGCRECANEENGKNKALTWNQFVEKAKSVHNNEYEYPSNCEYINNNTVVQIICKKHGLFPQTPLHHLSGEGCPECGREKTVMFNTKTPEKYIKDANIVHGGKYIYHSDYTKKNNTIRITCPIHGDFTQEASNHLQGHGCPRCSMSHLEREVEKLLTENDIKFESHYTPDFFKNKYMHLDFYLPDYNIGIECQGIQHFKPITIFGGDKEFEKRIKLDEEKYRLCEENGVRMVYVAKPSDMKLIDESKINSIYKNGIIQEVNGILENIL